MVVKPLTLVFLTFFSLPHSYAQSILKETHASDFDSRGAALTETLLKFANQQHLPIAIEYVDEDSISRAIDVSLKNATVAESLDSILPHGQGYTWTRQNGFIEI